jgi:hypothetical protein
VFGRNSVQGGWYARHWLTSELIDYVLGQTMEEQARAASAQSADPDEQVAHALSVFLDDIKRRLQ